MFKFILRGNPYGSFTLFGEFARTARKARERETKGTGQYNPANKTWQSRTEVVEIREFSNGLSFVLHSLIAAISVTVPERVNRESQEAASQERAASREVEG